MPQAVRLKSWRCPKCSSSYAWFDGTASPPPLVETETCKKCGTTFNAADLIRMGLGETNEPTPKHIEIVGDTAYELMSNLTNSQAKALVAEYAKLGLLYKKSKWKGSSCIITKAPAGEYKRFAREKEQHWQSIKKRVGYGNSCLSYSNQYVRGQTLFSPGGEWNDIVTFIEDRLSKRWWQFWR